MNLGTIWLGIRGDTSVARKDIDKLKRTSIQSAEVMEKRVSRSLSSLTKHWKMYAIAAAAALYAVNRLVKGFEALSAIQEKAEAGMVAAMKSMGRYTTEFESAILKTASALQGMSTFGDEAIIMGTKFLMTYGAISNEMMPRVMQAMTDLAALMKGDFVSAANMMGKASMGMTGELRRVGITVDSATFKSEGFIGVLKQIETQIKGQAAALKATKAGGLEAFGNIVDDVKEKLGFLTSTVKAVVAETLLPAVEDINKALGEWIENNAELLAQDIAGYISKLAAAIERLTAVYQKLAKWIEIFQRILSFGQADMKITTDQIKELQKLMGITPTVQPSKAKPIDPMAPGGPLYKPPGVPFRADVGAPGRLVDIQAQLATHALRRLDDQTKAIEELTKRDIAKFEMLLATSHEVSESIMDGLRKAGLEFIKAVRGAGLGLIEAVGSARTAESAADRFLNILGRRIGGLWGGIIQMIRLVFKGVAADFIAIIPDMVFALLKGIGENMPRMVKDIVPPIFEAILKGIPYIIRGFAASIPYLIDEFINGIPRVIDAIVTEIPKIHQIIIDCIVALLFWIERKWKEIWDDVARWWENMKKLSVADLVDVTSKLTFFDLVDADISKWWDEKGPGAWIPTNLGGWWDEFGPGAWIPEGVKEWWDDLGPGKWSLASVAEWWDDLGPGKWSLASIADWWDEDGPGSWSIADISLGSISIKDFVDKVSIADMFFPVSIAELITGGGGGGGIGGGECTPLTPWNCKWLHQGGEIPRAHAGILARDEVPIIAQTGERILSREQNSAFEAGALGGGGSRDMHIHLEMDGREVSHVIFNTLEFDNENVHSVRRAVT